VAEHAEGFKKKRQRAKTKRNPKTGGGGAMASRKKRRVGSKKILQRGWGGDSRSKKRGVLGMEKEGNKKILKKNERQKNKSEGVQGVNGFLISC